MAIAEAVKTYQNLIGGEWRPATNGATLAQLNTTNLTSLAAWRTASGRDASSLERDPNKFEAAFNTRCQEIQKNLYTPFGQVNQIPLGQVLALLQSMQVGPFKPVERSGRCIAEVVHARFELVDSVVGRRLLRDERCSEKSDDQEK